MPQQAPFIVPELTLKQDPILGTDIQKEDEIVSGPNTYDINSLTASLLSRPTKKVGNLILPLDPYTNLPIDPITAHKIAKYYKISTQEFLDFFLIHLQTLQQLQVPKF